MTDRALMNATAKRDALAAEINQLLQRVDDLKHEAARVDQFIAEWQTFAGVQLESNVERPENTDFSTEPTQGFIPGAAARRGRTTGNPKKELVAEVALEIIRDRGEPVMRSDLYKALVERGVLLQGTDPEMVLSTMLWRMMREGAPLVRLKSGGYWLADEPNEDAGYDPAADAEEADRILRENLTSLNNPEKETATPPQVPDGRSIEERLQELRESGKRPNDPA